LLKVILEQNPLEWLMMPGVLLMLTVARSLIFLILVLLPRVDAMASGAGFAVPEFFIHEELNGALNPSEYQDVESLTRNHSFQLHVSKDNKGYSANAHWVLIPLEPLGMVQPNPYWLEYGFPLIDNIDVYFLNDQGWHFASGMGDMRPWSARQRYGPNFYFQIPPDATYALVRLQTLGSMQFHFKIYDDTALDVALIDDAVFHGIFFGALIIMIFYNLFVFLMARDEAYLYYVILIASITLFELSVMGYGSMYLWRDNPSWMNSHVQAITVGLCLTFVVLFTRSILDIQSMSSALNKILLIECILSAIMAIVGALVSNEWMVRFTAIWPLFVVITVIISGGLAILRNRPGARIFVAAWGAGLVGAVLFSAQQQGWVATNEITVNSLKYGIVLNVVLLSFSMASHIRKLRQEKESYEKEARENYELALVDSLTGVPNRRAFDSVLEQEIERCRRDRRSISLMMIDIDYFKNFNDRYGHQQGDDTLVRAALIMRNALRRPSDALFRYGGEEFAVVLPDTDEEGARHTGERVISAIRKLCIPHEESPFKQVTVSIGAAVAKNANIGAEDFIQIADQAMYDAKRKGRNTFVLTEQRNTPVVNIGDYFKNTPKDTL